MSPGAVGAEEVGAHAVRAQQQLQRVRGRGRERRGGGALVRLVGQQHAARIPPPARAAPDRTRLPATRHTPLQQLIHNQQDRKKYLEAQRCFDECH